MDKATKQGNITLESIDKAVASLDALAFVEAALADGTLGNYNGNIVNGAQYVMNSSIDYLREFVDAVYAGIKAANAAEREGE